MQPMITATQAGKHTAARSPHALRASARPRPSFGGMQARVLHWVYWLGSAVWSLSSLEGPLPHYEPARFLTVHPPQCAAASRDVSGARRTPAAPRLVRVGLHRHGHGPSLPLLPTDNRPLAAGTSRVSPKPPLWRPRARGLRSHLWVPPPNSESKENGPGKKTLAYSGTPESRKPPIPVGSWHPTVTASWVASRSRLFPSQRLAHPPRPRVAEHRARRGRGSGRGPGPGDPPGFPLHLPGYDPAAAATRGTRPRS